MPRSMSRRQFLITSGVVSGAALAAGATGCSFHHLVAAGKKTPLAVGTKILVLVTMYGGNDGLNTVIPYTDKAYYAGRPDLAYEQADVLPLGAAKEALLRKIRQLDTASHMYDWVRSPGLQPPK